MSEKDSILFKSLFEDISIFDTILGVALDYLKSNSPTQPVMMKPKVAIVGAGAAGLGAA